MKAAARCASTNSIAPANLPRESASPNCSIQRPRFVEIGLLIAYDQYDGQAPAAGVVTGFGRIEGRPAVIVANDATVKAGAWWPETITKILRAQEIAMRNHVPIVYLVDSAGVNLPYQDGIFPGQYGAGRIFFYNSIMRRKLRVPQIAAVMGPCIAGGAYLPALSDVLIMVDKTSFMGLGGPNLVKGATGQSTDQETLGGARMHTTVSGVAHYLARNDDHCLEMIRERFRQFPEPPPRAVKRLRRRESATTSTACCRPIIASPIPWKKCCCAFSTARTFIEFQPEFAPEMLCVNARLDGRPVAIIANRRGFLKTSEGPRIGGIIYTESARKVAYFVEQAERARTPTHLYTGRFGLHGRHRRREFRDHSRGRGDGGVHVVRDRAEDRTDRESRERRRVLRDGRPGLRSQLHLRVANCADRRNGGRFRSAGAVLGRTGKTESYRPSDARRPQEAIARTRADYEQWLDAQTRRRARPVDAIIDPLDSRAILSGAGRTERLWGRPSACSWSSGCEQPPRSPQ